MPLSGRENDEICKCLIAVALACAAAVAGAQGWSPQRNVELVVPNPPGGSNDKTARTIERMWTIEQGAARRR